MVFSMPVISHIYINEHAFFHSWFQKEQGLLQGSSQVNLLTNLIHPRKLAELMKPYRIIHSVFLVQIYSSLLKTCCSDLIDDDRCLGGIKTLQNYNHVSDMHSVNRTRKSLEKDLAIGRCMK